MASNTDLALRIAAIYDASGMNKADKSVKGFEKTLKKLGKTLGITLSAAAIVKFGKDSAKAFIEDEKQAKRLSIAVKNLGLQFYDANITDFIDRLTIASGVTDDQLRPALQKLLTTTGDVTKSQQLLKQAIDVSAGSGVDLTTVSEDLANAYVGNTKGLKKYYLGLSQAQLKTMSFADIQAKLNKQFAGANQQYLQTYAGQMSILTVAAGEAQEVIGGALIQSLMDFTGAVDAADLAEKIGGWSKALAKFIGDFTWGLKKLWFMTSDRALLESINPFSNYIEKGLAKIDAERAASEWKRAIAGALPYDPTNNAVTGFQRDRKAAADAAKRARENAKLLAKNTAELKKQTALKKAGSVFDQEQIQLIAALKGKLTDEERKRVEAMAAILNGNDVLAQTLTKQILMAQDATGGLYQYFLSIGDAKIKNPFAFLDDWIKQFQDKLNALKVPSINPNGTLSNVSIGSQGGIGTTTISPSISSNAAIQGTFDKVLLDQLASGAGLDQAATLALSSARYAGAAQQYSQPVINVTVQGRVIREAELIDRIADATQGRSLSGSPSQIGRIQGMFSL